MRTVDADKHAVQRQAILNAARACFAQNGFHRTSTEMLCVEAGTSSGKLFHYFPNKKSIILAVVEDQIRQTATYLEDLLGQSDLSRALTDFIDLILQLAGDPQERRLILEIAAEGARDADVAALNAAGDKHLANALTALVTGAIAQGQLHPVTETPHVVSFLMTVIDGIFSRVSVDAGFDPAVERASLQKIVRVVIGLHEDHADA